MKRFCVLVLAAALVLPLASCTAGTAAETAVVAEAVVTSAAPNESVKEETLPAAGDDGEASGESDETEAVKLSSANVTAADGTADDSEPPYWNGMDFGPNVEYTEEYVQQGDPGEYPTAAEGAQTTFFFAKENGNIPEYSDETEYTMVLTDITDVNGEECYVYRLDIDEPTGTLGAAYAYGYQSGNIYMEGYGGQWVIISNAGDPNAIGFADIFDFSSMILSFWHGSGAGAWSGVPIWW